MTNNRLIKHNLLQFMKQPVVHYQTDAEPQATVFNSVNFHPSCVRKDYLCTKSLFMQRLEACHCKIFYPLLIVDSN